MKKSDEHRFEETLHDEWWLDQPEDVPEKVPELEQTRRLVKESDPIDLPEDAQFYDNLHAKIMASIEQEDFPEEETEKPAWILPPRPKERRPY